MGRRGAGFPPREGETRAAPNPGSNVVEELARLWASGGFLTICFMPSTRHGRGGLLSQDWVAASNDVEGGERV